MNPRVSVVIASYNHAEFVGECLASVLAQTFADWELVVTDDGSTDGTAAVVRGFAAAHPRARIDFVALEENRGACIALNLGVRRARGEFVAILNSDDVFLPDKLARQVAFLDAHPQVGAVFGWPRLIDQRGRPFDDPSHKDTAVFRQPNRPRHAWLRHFFDHGNALCHPTVLIRRRCYGDAGMYDARLAQVPDLDLWIRLTMKHEIHVLAEPLICFRILDAQRNASAARPEVVIRDAWERRHVLDRFLAIGVDDFAAAFPEYRGRPEPRQVLLAHRALGLGSPFHVQFGLDTLYLRLAADGSGPEYAEFIRLTGALDPYGLRPARAAAGGAA
jgi:glycosyltransferase involved in cell wall biosynthesis